MLTTQPLPRLSKPKAILLCAATWFIPGLGYVLVKDYARGISLFVLLGMCFIVGVLLGGTIQEPVWNRQHPDFNWVAILNYIVAAFHGSGWVLLQLAHTASESNPEAFFNAERMAAKSAYWDLGAFHLIVAAGLNYLSIMRLYDLTAGNPELMASSSAKAKPAQKTEEK